MVWPEENLELVFQNANILMQNNGESKVCATCATTVLDLTLKLGITFFILGNDSFCAHLVFEQVVSDK